MQSIQGLVPIIPSIAVCEGLGQLSCSLTLGLSHMCLCHQGSSIVLPRLGVGPVLLTAIANEGSRASSLTLMPSEVSLFDYCKCWGWGLESTTHTCYIRADKWQGHLSFTFYLGDWIICAPLTRTSLITMLPRQGSGPGVLSVVVDKGAVHLLL